MAEPAALLAAIQAAFGEARDVGLACFDRDTLALRWAVGACERLLAFEPQPRKPALPALVEDAAGDGVLFNGVATFQPARGEFASTLGTVVLQGGQVVLLVEPLKQSPERALRQMADLVRSASVRQRDLMKRKLLAERRERLLAGARDQAVPASRVDPLTGLATRAHGLGRLAVELSVAERQGSPLSVLALDLDHFKGINDSWGHGVGDRALAAVGRHLVSLCGGYEAAVRMGGEEFMLVLPGLDEAAALAFGDRVRREVRALDDEGLPPLTVSGGVAQWRAGEASTDLLRRADEALYAAKSAGRDRVHPWAGA